MTESSWSIRGVHLINCDCDYGCPCQFNALPSHGDCHAVVTSMIDEGHWGATGVILTALGGWLLPD